MAADGSIIIDVDLDDANASSSLKGLRSDSEDLGRSGSVSVEKLAASFYLVTSAAKAAVGIVKSVASTAFEVGGALVQAAGSASALNSQFSQVFGTLEKQATNSLNAIATQTNILPNRLRGSFTTIAAFARTTGSDQAQALDIASRATLAAADSAAFYDRSIESVTESLQSYLKGNFENDAALGISSTETTRNAAANALYGKSFKDLDEAQKQLTLLRQVEEGNRLSGALGQAAREGTGLENVTGNLQQAFTDLQARLGERILEPVIEGIVFLTNVLERVDLGSVTQGFRNFFDSLDEGTNGGLRSAINGFRNFASQVGEYFSLISSNVSRVVDDLVPRFQEFFRTIIASFRSNIQFIVSFWQENGDAILRATVQSLNAVVNFVGGILRTLLDFWNDNGAQITQAAQNIWSLVLAVIQFALPPIVALVQIAWNNIKTTVEFALDVILGLVNIFIGILTLDFETVWNGITRIFQGAIDFILSLYQASFISNIVDATINFIGNVIQFFADLWDSIVSLVVNGAQIVVELFVGLGQGILRAAEVALGYTLLAVITFFETIILGVLNFAESVINYIQDLRSRGGNIFLNFLSDVRQLFVDTFKTVREFVSNFVESVVTFFTNLKDRAVGQVSETKTSVENGFSTLRDNVINFVQNLYETVVQFFVNLRNSIVNIFTEFIPNLIGQIRQFVVDFVNTIRRLYTDGVQAVKDFANGAIDVVKELPAQFLQYGKDVIRGFIDGIKSFNPISAVRNVFDGVKNTVKDIFDINSPSKWARDEIYGGIIEGFDAGSEKYGSEALAIGADLAQMIQNPFANLSPSLGGLGINGNGVGTATSPINNNNSRNANYVINVTGDDQAQEFERTMRRLQFGF